MKWATLTLIALAAVLVFAQTQTKPQLSDKKQRFAVWYDEFSTEFSEPNVIDFEFSGKPMHGYSRDQNLEFSSRSMTGKLLRTTDAKTKESTLTLRRGVLAGEATLTITDANGKTVFRSAKATIEDDGTTADVTVPGSFTTVNTTTDAKGSRTLTVTGSSGTFKLKSLTQKDKNPLLNSEVSGPVTIRSDETQSTGKNVLYTITGQKLTMRASGTDKILELSGNVHISGDQSGADGPGLLADMDVNQATVILDENNKVKKISSKGSPGTGTVREKKDGS